MQFDTEIGLNVGRGRATPLFLILQKVALDYLYLLPIGCRKNNFIMTVKCQNVVKCELYMYSRYQNFSECKNCVASFETTKRKIKIVRINLKSTFFFVQNAVDVGNVFTKTLQTFQK